RHAPVRHDHHGPAVLARDVRRDVRPVQGAAHRGPQARHPPGRAAEQPVGPHPAGRGAGCGVAAAARPARLVPGAPPDAAVPRPDGAAGAQRGVGRARGAGHHDGVQRGGGGRHGPARPHPDRRARRRGTLHVHALAAGPPHADVPDEHLRPGRHLLPRRGAARGGHPGLRRDGIRQGAAHRRRAGPVRAAPAVPAREQHADARDRADRGLSTMSTPTTPATLYIDGTWTAAAAGRTREIRCPADGSLVAEVSEAAPADTERAIAAARRAFDTGPWRDTTGPDRGELLHRVADLLTERKEDFALAESRDTGKRLVESRIDMDDCIACFRWFAKLAGVDAGRVVDAGSADVLSRVVHEPVGVCALIAPWNYPLLQAVWKVAPCLAAGNTFVLK